MATVSRVPATFWPPRWFFAAIVIFGIAIALGAVGPDWLTPLVVAPAGLLIVRGAWPFATGRHTVPSRALFGMHFAWIGRVWGVLGVLIGVGWAVGGVAGFIQQIA